MSQPPSGTKPDKTETYGEVEQVSPLIRRVLARNPGPFTFTGTGTYIVGHGRVAVIDPGPRDKDHLTALCRAVEGETITHIVITHTHIDHSPAARPLKEACGAPILAHGPHPRTAGAGMGPESGDQAFRPDKALRHGEIIEGDGWTLECVHTPGHTSNHMCYALREEQALFSGDHVMGWSTSVIAPPDGNMGDYLNSLRALLKRKETVYWPTHGQPVSRPQSYVSALIKHRLMREGQIKDGLRAGLCDIPSLVEQLYADLDPRLKPAAALSVYAHLLHMIEQAKVQCLGEPNLDARYRLL